MYRIVIFFCAILLVVIELLFFEFNYIFIVVLCLICLRILCTKSICIVNICLIWCLGCITYIFNYYQCSKSREIKQELSVKNQHILVYADNIKVNGDLLTLTGRWLEGKQQICTYYYLKSKAEQNYFKKQINSDVYTVTGKIKGISPPTNENEFDYKKFCQSKKIYNGLTVKHISLENNKVPSKYKLLCKLHDLRKSIICYLQLFPKYLQGYSTALIVGYRDDEFDDINSSIKELGLLYLFSLSGMHVFYLVKILQKLAQILRITAETVDMWLIICLPIYMILAGSSSSIIRAVFMVWIPIFSRYFLSIKIDKLTSWSLTIIINLLYSPMILFTMGMQLSYLLTLVLILNEEENSIKIGIKMSGYSIPLMLWHTYQWNVLTTFLSICIIPIFEYIILPFTIIGVLLNVFSKISNTILFLISIFFEKLADSSPMITFGKPYLMVVILLLSLMICLEVSRRKNVIIYLQVLVYIFSYSQIHRNKDELVYFDIGQGDATLIREKNNNQVILVDTGGKVSFKHEKWRSRVSQTSGERVIVNYLLSKGINSIDKLYLTHQDADHVGNFPSISQKIKIKKILVPLGMEKLSSFNKRLNESNICNDKVVEPITDTSDFSKERIDILHPFVEGKGKNEDSIVLKYTMGRLIFLITGDLDQENEIKVIEKYPDLRCDILKVGHHGSKTSTADQFVKSLKPQYAIISVGLNNRYGHPNIETLRTLNANGIPYLMTSDKGMIKVVNMSKNKFCMSTKYGKILIRK